jgi:hypothetical protein
MTILAAGLITVSERDLSETSPDNDWSENHEMKHDEGRVRESIAWYEQELRGTTNPLLLSNLGFCRDLADRALATVDVFYQTAPVEFWDERNDGFCWEANDSI